MVQVNANLGLLQKKLAEKTALGKRVSAHFNRHIEMLISSMEHHSNELPWRHSLARSVTRIGYLDKDPNKGIDFGDLERKLRDMKLRGVHEIYIALSAASNVTGVLTDVHAAAQLVHRYGGKIFPDFGAAAPYVKIDMHPEGWDEPGHLNYEAHLDGVMFSPHKFPGGPGTPGVLVVNKSVIRNQTPVVDGGGTVTYVNSEAVHYDSNPEVREQGGTPPILGIIQTALVMAMQQRLGYKNIAEREVKNNTYFLERWAALEARFSGRLVLYGHRDPESRLGIFSFNIFKEGVDTETATYKDLLPFNLIVQLLNDHYGIQVRGGCSCAGPYGHDLLGIPNFEADAIRSGTIPRPGWIRASVHYLHDQADIDYLIDALEHIFENLDTLSADYHLDAAHGVWVHRDAVDIAPALTLQKVEEDLMDATGLSIPS